MEQLYAWLNFEEGILNNVDKINYAYVQLTSNHVHNSYDVRYIW